jgi:transcriptional regulator GlxA family with amidase domain
LAVAFLIYPEFQLLDLAGPLAVFETAGRLGGRAYALATYAVGGGLVAPSCGIPVLSAPLDALAQAPAPDTLLVVGGYGSRQAMQDARLLEALRGQGARARRVGSVCSGAFVLAASGWLDGRRATTHWARSQEFARCFPQVRLEPDCIHVQDGPVWTSAGITAGTDLALALLAADQGEALARAVARQLVVYYRRPGGQSQFSALLEMSPSGGRFATLLDYIRQNPGAPLDVDSLAERCHMSPRHFARSFRAELGITPARAVERLRIEAACAALEEGGLSVKAVAERYGFGDPERLRRACQRVLGISPVALRRGGGYGGDA